MAVCIQGDLLFWNKRRSFHGFSPLGEHIAAFESQPSVAKRARLTPSEELSQLPPPSSLDAAAPTPANTAAATPVGSSAAVGTESKPREGVQVGIVHRVKPDGGSWHTTVAGISHMP